MEDMRVASSARFRFDPQNIFYDTEENQVIFQDRAFCPKFVHIIVLNGTGLPIYNIEGSGEVLGPVYLVV